LRKDGSGFGQIYQAELGLIRVGSKKSSCGRMNQGWVRYIKLSKDVSGLDWIYQVKEEWINLGQNIKLSKDGYGLGRKKSN